MGRDVFPNRIPLFQGRGMSRGADLGLCGTHGSCPQIHGRVDSCNLRALPCCPQHPPHCLLFFQNQQT